VWQVDCSTDASRRKTDDNENCDHIYDVDCMLPIPYETIRTSHMTYNVNTLQIFFMSKIQATTRKCRINEKTKPDKTNLPTILNIE